MGVAMRACTIAVDPVRRLTAARPTKRTSTPYRSARQPNPAGASLIHAEKLFRQSEPPITATFDGGTLSSNGGVLILREIEKKLGLATVLSRHIPDDRDGRRVRHSSSDMTRARMFAIAGEGDLDVLRSDPCLEDGRA
jgi:hypothetical protein